MKRVFSLEKYVGDARCPDEKVLHALNSGWAQKLEGMEVTPCSPYIGTVMIAGEKHFVHNDWTIEIPEPEAEK